VKMHGLKNHFVIVDGRDASYCPGKDEIIAVCDPQSGVGADQLVIIEPPSEAAKERGAHAFMRILNVDGREVEACGNATRCVAWLLLQETGAENVNLETKAGVLLCQRAGDRQVRCEMGKVSMDWRDIPLSCEADTLHLDIDAGPLSAATALSIGNPHIVFFVDDMDAIDLPALAPSLQANDLFPNEVNVGLAQLLDADNLRLKVYERGAGLTTACGSGACVAVYAAIARGLTEARKMTVTMPAGQVVIEIHADDTAVMTGPVAHCFSGYLPRR